MKSKLIRVKVWYEHSGVVTAPDIQREIEATLSKALRNADRDERGAVIIHQVDVGDTPATRQPKRPTPDF